MTAKNCGTAKFREAGELDPDEFRTPRSGGTQDHQGARLGELLVAVIAAHDKALRLLPPGRQLTGQPAMMLVMVGYTFTGLYLLFGG